MQTAEAKAKKVKTAQDRLDRLLEKRTNLLSDVEKVDKEIRLATLDWEHRKAAPTVEDAEGDTQSVAAPDLEPPVASRGGILPPVYPDES